jgi:hypothetical protein
MKTPLLTFACELENEALEKLFSDATVIETLQQVKCGLALGLLDLSDRRAAVVQKLNQAGIPVTAWLLLPKEQGYWFNVGNYPQAIAFYEQFKTWSAAHRMTWAGIGLDIEPDYNEMRQLIAGQGRDLGPIMLRRIFQPERLQHARQAYTTLISQMRADGYRVDSYQMPFIVDERQAGSSFLQKLLGLVDVAPDREALMLYTSFIKNIGPDVLWSYAPQAGIIGVGSTGGGVEIEGEPPPLDWEAFRRDLLLANRIGRDEIFVFSLEGCLRQGFLPKLIAFDWSQPISPPHETARQVDSFRKLGRGCLWASAHPLLVIIGVTGIIWLIKRAIRLGKRL